jgi:hypothetical protein
MCAAEPDDSGLLMNVPDFFVEPSCRHADLVLSLAIAYAPLQVFGHDPQIPRCHTMSFSWFLTFVSPVEQRMCTVPV